MTELIHMFSYHFMQRAVLVGVLVSLCAALLGVSLVLKRYSMKSDADISGSISKNSKYFSST